MLKTKSFNKSLCNIQKTLKRLKYYSSFSFLKNKVRFFLYKNPIGYTFLCFTVMTMYS